MKIDRKIIAERICRKAQCLGTRQVRYHAGMFLTYPYPARRGYGVRGILVGVYGLTTRLEWILDDILAVVSDTKY